MKKWFLMCMLALSATTMAIAAAPTGQDAKAMVEQQAKIITGKLNNNFSLYKKNPDAFNQLVASDVLPYMDFELMSRYVLGPHWNQATSQQRQAFINAFRDFLVRKYSGSWADLATKYVEIPIDEKNIVVLGTPKVDQYQRADVRVQLHGKNGKKARVAFSLRFKNGQWKMYDVVFENVSLLSGYRNTFNTEINKDGLDQLIANLKNNKTGK